MADVMEDQVTAYVWTDGEEYEDKRCAVDVTRMNELGAVDLSVYIDGRGALIQFQFSRDEALAMAEAFLRSARA